MARKRPESLQRRIDRLGRRHAAAREVPRDRDADERHRDHRRAPRWHGDREPPGDGPEQDGEEGPALDQRITADELRFREVLRQDAVLDRAEDRDRRR